MAPVEVVIKSLVGELEWTDLVQLRKTSKYIQSALQRDFASRSLIKLTPTYKISQKSFKEDWKHLELLFKGAAHQNDITQALFCSDLQKLQTVEIIFKTLEKTPERVITRMLRNCKGYKTLKIDLTVFGRISGINSRTIDGTSLDTLICKHEGPNKKVWGFKSELNAFKAISNFVKNLSCLAISGYYLTLDAQKSFEELILRNANSLKIIKVESSYIFPSISEGNLPIFPNLRVLLGSGYPVRGSRKYFDFIDAQPYLISIEVFITASTLEWFKSFLASRGANLVSLRVTCVDFLQLNQLTLENCTKLTCLELKCQEWRNSIEVLFALLRIITTLSTSHLQSFYMQFPLVLPLNRYFDWFDSRLFGNIINLKLHRCREAITDEHIAQICKNLVKLKTLEVLGSLRITDDGFLGVRESSCGKTLNNLKDLKSLGIGYCDNITDRCVRSVMQLGSLTELCFSGSSQITYEGFAEIINKRSMKTLKIDHNLDKTLLDMNSSRPVPIEIIN